MKTSQTAIHLIQMTLIQNLSSNKSSLVNSATKIVKLNQYVYIAVKFTPEILISPHYHSSC